MRSSVREARQHREYRYKVGDILRVHIERHALASLKFSYNVNDRTVALFAVGIEIHRFRAAADRVCDKKERCL